MEGILDDKPPPSKTNLDISSRLVSAYNSLVRQSKGFWQSLGYDRSIPAVRGFVFNRRLLVLENIRKE